MELLDTPASARDAGLAVERPSPMISRIRLRLIGRRIDFIPELEWLWLARCVPLTSDAPGWSSVACNATHGAPTSDSLVASVDRLCRDTA